jgi:mannose-6-phosphate isomerase-like protein (cupin superfamily)
MRIAEQRKTTDNFAVERTRFARRSPRRSAKESRQWQVTQFNRPFFASRLPYQKDHRQLATWLSPSGMAHLRWNRIHPMGNDPQRPHDRDEVYVVARGQAVFFDGTYRHPVEPGSFLFVAANHPRRFEDMSLDFAVWVVFYGPRGGKSG